MTKRYEYKKGITTSGKEVKVFKTNDGEKVILKNKIQYRQVWNPKAKTVKNVL